MKLNRIFALCVLPLACSANAEDYNFAMIKSGFDQPLVSKDNAHTSSVNSTYNGGVEVGRKFKDIFAVGLEYSYRGKSNIKTENIQYGSNTTSATWAVRSNVFFVNFSADIVQDKKFTPYVKAGLGVAANKSYDYVQTDNDPGYLTTTSTYQGKTKNNFAWQLGFGVSAAYNEKIDIDFSYMFSDRGKVETNQNYTLNGLTVNSPAKYIKLQDHLLTIGIKFKF